MADLINNFPAPGVVDTTDASAVQDRADDANDYNNNNGIDSRYAVVPIVNYRIFPVENSDELTAFNAKTDSEKRAYYNNWIKTLEAYPPL